MLFGPKINFTNIEDPMINDNNENINTYADV